MIKYKIRDSYWLTFPLIIVSFNHFFVQPATGYHIHVAKKMGKTAQNSKIVDVFRKFSMKKIVHDFNIVPQAEKTSPVSVHARTYS